MKGVRCSWIEMQRLYRNVLPAVERGDGGKYAELRCVDPATVSTWRRAADVMELFDEEGIDLSQFESFQPTHAREISRHFRKHEKDGWSDDTKEKILDIVDRCESEQMTVEQLKTTLKNPAAEVPWTLVVALEKLGDIVRKAADKWPAEHIEVMAHKLRSMGDEILANGGLAE